MFHLCSGRHQDCNDSISEQRPPSSCRSSELLLATENSTETGCKKKRHTGEHVIYNNTSIVHKTVISVQVNVKDFRKYKGTNLLTYRRACTKLRSVNSWRSTNACNTLILKSSLKERYRNSKKMIPLHTVIQYRICNIKHFLLFLTPLKHWLRLYAPLKCDFDRILAMLRLPHVNATIRSK